MIFFFLIINLISQEIMPTTQSQNSPKLEASSLKIKTKWFIFLDFSKP